MTARLKMAAVALALLASVSCDTAADQHRELEALNAASARASSVSAGRFQVDAADSVVANQTAAAEVHRTCSRPAPVGLSGYWEPTVGDLGALESALPAWLEAHMPAGELPLNYDRVRLYRQYVGMLKGGKRVIYVNAWPIYKELPNPAGARDRIQIGCGGGKLNFGVVYDVTTREFSDFQGNGPM